jgi:hypothetical protein
MVQCMMQCLPGGGGGIRIVYVGVMVLGSLVLGSLVLVGGLNFVF